MFFFLFYFAHKQFNHRLVSGGYSFNMHQLSGNFTLLLGLPDTGRNHNRVFWSVLRITGILQDYGKPVTHWLCGFIKKNKLAFEVNLYFQMENWDKSKSEGIFGPVHHHSGVCD